MLHVRLRNELERLGIKPAAAARAAGEPDSQGLRDVLGGRKRLSADLLAAIGATSGVDVLYVLTGERNAPSPVVLSSDEQELLALFRAAPLAVKATAIGGLRAGAQAAPPTIGKQVNVTANGGQAAGRDIKNRAEHYEGSRQVFNGPVGDVAGRDVVKTGRKRKE